MVGEIFARVLESGGVRSYSREAGRHVRCPMQGILFMLSSQYILCSDHYPRLGAKEMELAVWEFPREGEGRAEYSAILAGCENLWREHILAKLAIPEVGSFR